MIAACGLAPVLVAPAAWADSPVRATPVAPVAPVAVVAVVDARAPSPQAEASHARFVAALAAVNGVAVITDERATALAGRVVDADDRLAAEALAEARDGFGALDCGRARPAAEDAVRLLAGRQAAGLDEGPRLTAAWTYVLLCAERDGDPSAARAAADRLRALGGSPGVPADLWAKYPDIDVTVDRDIVALTVTGPAGATIWVDHTRVGPAPVTTFVAAGKHLIAAATGSVRGSTVVTAHAKPATVVVPVEERRARFAGIAGQVAAWQVGDPPTAVELTEVMAALEVRFVVVLGAGNEAALWVRAPRSPTVQRVARGSLDNPLAVGNAVVERASYWTEGGPDPDRPLLTETDHPEPSRADGPTQWWIYAAIGGALATGALTLYALEAGTDQQRIELDF